MGEYEKIARSLYKSLSYLMGQDRDGTIHLKGCVREGHGKDENTPRVTWLCEQVTPIWLAAGAVLTKACPHCGQELSAEDEDGDADASGDSAIQ